MSSWNVQATEKELVAHHIRVVGGTTDLTTDTDGGGYGITPAYSATGVYTLTWDENPGDFVDASFNLGAATPANLAGYTVVRDTYASNVLSFSVFNELFAAADLAALEYVDIVVYFRG